MDPTLYKTLQVSRRFTYRYYSSPAKDSGSRTILFLHGFPNADTDWRHQVSFFKERGYGLIVPQLLGYGESSKPTDPADYRQSLMSKDLTEILDAEGVKQVVVIGHDWGAYVASRFALFKPERTLAVGFVTVGYYPTNTGSFDIKAVHEITKERFGYELFGYWEFFSASDAPKLCIDNFESFFNIIWPDDPKRWATDMAPVGAFRKNVEANKIFPPPSWMSEENKRLISEPLLKNGFAAPMCYYRVQTTGMACEDDKLLDGRKEINQPVFFLDALDDYVASEGRFQVASGETESPVLKYCKNPTIKRVKVDHWVMLHIPDELNTALLEWLGNF
ncbi:hypothetical protein V5O48_014512 [Marasmius crinis-equi]|uniref:AB hydrolase-1 domain-containing protein n=1 Tax=Marasmius crinis-equi TaxID=585013 RepID=A0ABR3EX31_9AGAR